MKDGEVIIVDEHTGRTMQGVAGLTVCTEAVEAKEGVEIQNETRRWRLLPSELLPSV